MVDEDEFLCLEGFLNFLGDGDFEKVVCDGRCRLVGEVGGEVERVVVEEG